MRRSPARTRDLVAATVLGLAFAGCGEGGSAENPAGERTAVGEPEREAIVRALARAYFPGRVGDIAVIPGPGAIITSPGPDYRYMHGSPWSHDTAVPLLLYGPGVFEPGTYRGPASHQDIGATLTTLLGLPPRADVTGRPLRAAFSDGGNEADGGQGDAGARPGLVAVLVLDAMRADYLDRYADLLPNLTRLAAGAARFAETRVDYVPTNTSTAHTTLSTGTDPSVHGIVGNTLYDRRTGQSTVAYEGASPRNLMALTVADRWGVATRGRAEIVVQGGTDYPAVALAGHGRCILGGHSVWLSFYDSGSGGWTTNEACFRLPPAARELHFGPRLDAVDRLWLGHELDSYGEARRSALFSGFEGEAAVAFIEGSAFGEDDVTDLFLANLKGTDYVSHKYGPFSPEMEATLAELDGWLGRIVEALEAKAGPGGLALIVTADHGMPDTPASDDLWATYGDVTAWLNERVDPGGPGVVAFYEGSENQMYLDPERLGALGLEPDDVARTLEESPVVRFAITEREVRQARQARFTREDPPTRRRDGIP
ncbi:alkaline phosphatase family protein [Candidatus Palauibacter sp.]|uniref:alkaline phosphatase family protein n=1 Tax=Candidatus Palauibacter sp. TaxID=3101350 RepID=UPI003B521A16